MEEITKEALKYLENNHTKVEVKEGFMGNYYSHLIDTIYIAENFEGKNIPKSIKHISPKVAQLITICHECIHSMQNQTLHSMNTIFSNLSIILSILSIAWGVFGERPLWICITAIITTLIAIIMRLVLEVGAINDSTKLAFELVKKGIITDVVEQDVKVGREFIHKHKFMALSQMIIDKIIFLVLILLVK